MEPDKIEWTNAGDRFAVAVNTRIIAHCNNSSDADRIVACLKALAIFNTEAIKNGRAIEAIRNDLIKK